MLEEPAHYPPSVFFVHSLGFYCQSPAPGRARSTGTARSGSPACVPGVPAAAGRPSVQWSSVSRWSANRWVPRFCFVLSAHKSDFRRIFKKKVYEIRQPDLTRIICLSSAREPGDTAGTLLSSVCVQPLSVCWTSAPGRKLRPASGLGSDRLLAAAAPLPAGVSCFDPSVECVFASRQREALSWMMHRVWRSWKSRTPFTLNGPHVSRPTFDLFVWADKRFCRSLQITQIKICSKSL